MILLSFRFQKCVWDMLRGAEIVELRHHYANFRHLWSWHGHLKRKCGSRSLAWRGLDCIVSPSLQGAPLKLFPSLWTILTLPIVVSFHPDEGPNWSWSLSAKVQVVTNADDTA